MIKLWGRQNAINVQKVLWCCDEIGFTDYKRIDAGLSHGLNKEPFYLAMNPNGLVPTIEDDGLVVWESNSIVRYLCARYGGESLYPAGAVERAPVEQWMDWSLSVLWPSMVYIFLMLIRRPPETWDRKELDANIDRAVKAWRIVDEQLAPRPYLLGDRLSLADLAVGVWTYRWFEMPIEGRPEFPRVRDYYSRLQERPGFRARVMLPIT